MPQTRATKTNKFRRDAWVEVNLENLEHNLKEIYSSVQSPLMPVVKADAYGHGASIISPILEAYDFVQGFGVASIDEAISLRESGIKKDILVLGITPAWAFEAAIKHNIQITLVDINSAEALNNVTKQMNSNAKVHIKIDTGMNRIGFKENEFKVFINKLKELANLKIEYIFSHFADIQDLDFCQEQLAKFTELCSGLGFKKHLASSAAARVLKDSRFDLVRCGIELYGLKAAEDDFYKKYPLDIKALMSLYSRISYIKEIDKDETVSYSRTWRAEQNCKIATLPLGYADGIPRLLSNKMHAYTHGMIVKQVGLITMDQLMLDLSPVAQSKVGDLVELIGANISIDEWAKSVGTINYELATSLNLRLAKTYTRPE